MPSPQHPGDLQQYRIASAAESPPRRLAPMGPQSSPWPEPSGSHLPPSTPSVFQPQSNHETLQRLRVLRHSFLVLYFVASQCLTLNKTAVQSVGPQSFSNLAKKAP